MLSGGLYDIYSYEYVDDIIGQPARFFFKYRKAIQECTEWNLCNLLLHADKGYGRLKMLLKQFNLHDGEIDQQMGEAQKMVDNIRKLKNKTYAIWFNKLLDLCSIGFDVKKAEALSMTFQEEHRCEVL